MFGIGITELVLIAVAALIFIGPKKLPEVAKTVGKAFGEFKKAADELKGQVADQVTGIGVDEKASARPPRYSGGPAGGGPVPEGHSTGVVETAEGAEGEGARRPKGGSREVAEKPTGGKPAGGKPAGARSTGRKRSGGKPAGGKPKGGKSGKKGTGPA